MLWVTSGFMGVAVEMFDGMSFDGVVQADRGRENLESMDLFQEIYPAVIPLATRLDIKKPLEDFPDHQFLSDLYYLVARLDEHTDATIDDLSQVRDWEVSADGGVKFVSGRILHRLATEDEVKQHQNEYVDKLLGLDAFASRKNISLQFAFPPYGAVPIEYDLEGKIDGNRLHNVWIQGSDETTTGGAQIIRQLPEEIQNPANYVVFADDVLDSGNSALRVALARRSIRLKTEVADLPNTYLPKDIARLHKEEGLAFDNERFRSLFDEAARIMREEKVILLPFYSKNKLFLQQLNNRAETEGLTPMPSEWPILQTMALDNVKEWSPHDWIMGGQGQWALPLLDTGISGKAILKYVSDESQQELVRLGLPDMVIRFGAGIKGLVGFNPDGVRDGDKDIIYDHLVKSLAAQVDRLMQERMNLQTAA